MPIRELASIGTAARNGEDEAATLNLSWRSILTQSNQLTGPFEAQADIVNRVYVIRAGEDLYEVSYDDVALYPGGAAILRTGLSNGEGVNMPNFINYLWQSGMMRPYDPEPTE